MNTIDNGISAGDLPHAVWRKSSKSGSQGGNCVEVAPLPTGQIAMRNSRDPDGPALIFTREEIDAFVAGAKAGEFDPLVTDDTTQRRIPEIPEPVTENRRGTTPARYQVINSEVQRLTSQLLEGDTVLDREASERLLRILSGVALLHRMHRVDRNGNCTICHTRSRRWHPARHDECSVYAALSLYLGRSLMVPNGPNELVEPSVPIPVSAHS